MVSLKVKWGIEGKEALGFKDPKWTLGNPESTRLEKGWKPGMG